MPAVVIDGEKLTLEEVERVVIHGSRVRLSAQAREKMHRSRQLVEEILSSKEVVYGINTGFGKLCQVVIPKNQIERLQRNLVVSHAAGVGSPLPDEVVRAMMLLRANVLAKGYSGVRPELSQALVSMLNGKVHPVVPEQGSVGASGDLAPLSHMALAIMGQGQVRHQGKLLSAAGALKKLGMSPLRLQAKEGLALTNGTQAMTALGCLTLLRGERLAKTADISGALSLEVLLGTPVAFHRNLQRARPHKGQGISARNLRVLVRDSQIVALHQDCSKIQDAYSLRCMPQVHGAARDALSYVRGVLQVEINSATDNPLVFAEENQVLSGGNFHGQPVALALDFLGLALCQLANIAERRVASLLDPNISQLPAFLAPKGGINSGFMMAQTTAAALVSENKILAHPASVDSIPTSANQEDHVSMGMTAGRKAMRILKNAEMIMGIELICAAQGVDLRSPLKPGHGTMAAYQAVRKRIPRMDDDRILAPDLERAASLVREGEVLRAVERVVGRLL
jgi:histidine ammonia-lyase